MCLFIKLFNGNLCPISKINPDTEEYQKINDKLSNMEESLDAEMTEKQKKLFEAYIETRNESELMLQEEVFMHGFTLGLEIQREMQKVMKKYQ